MTPPKVFICYARKDNPKSDDRLQWLEMVRTRLRPYDQRREMEVFADVDIDKGDMWRKKILGQLREARIVVVLISENLLASDFVREHEMPLILDRQSKDELTIIPVVLNPCDYNRLHFKFPHADDGPNETLLSEFQSAGSPSLSLIEMTAAEQALTLNEVALTVRKKAEEWTKRSSSDSSSSISSSSGQAQLAQFTNSLGMRFVPVPGIKAWFSLWQTRVCDYAEYAKANPKIDGSWKDPVFKGVPVTPGPLHPVVNVSWQDAVAFCQWLTQKEQSEGKLNPGESYRLPTDMEWSAAVGLTGESGRTPKDRNGEIKDVYPWGKQWPPVDAQGKPLGNFADESAKARFPEWTIISGYEDGFPTTSPVGRFHPSANGLLDMAGNVWEWCDDLYQPFGTARVLRGGSWVNNLPECLLSSSRDFFAPGARGALYGFRCVVELGGAAPSGL